MNVAIELHDSDIGSVSFNGGALEIEFSTAYLHCSEGRPGVDAGEGHLQPVLLSFGSAKLIGVFPQRLGRLSDGKLSICGEDLHLIPVPAVLRGPVHACFLLASGDSFTVEAGSLVSTRFGQDTFIERFPG